MHILDILKTLFLVVFMKVFLSIDFGIRYIGISIGTFSGSVLVLPVYNYTSVINWYHLLAIVKEWDPCVCLVGYNFNHSSFLNDYINLFLVEFFYLTSIPVIKKDEFLSTFFLKRSGYGVFINSYSSLSMLKDSLFDV
jgi:RNase H-fold protein (predicted Holliday junction resolvase)